MIVDFLQFKYKIEDRFISALLTTSCGISGLCIGCDKMRERYEFFARTMPVLGCDNLSVIMLRFIQLHTTNEFANYLHKRLFYN